MTDTTLVTGVSGFAGGHLAEYFAGSRPVVGWHRSAPLHPLPAAVRVGTVDLLDRDAVRSAIRQLRPRFVFHLAGASHVQGAWADPALVLRANVLGTHHLLDALRRTAVDGCRVLISGSAAVYAPSEAPLREDALVRPDGPYGFSKLAQEILGRHAASEDGLDVVLTRSFNHTGPRQSATFMASGIARQIALIERGAIEPVLHVGNLDARRDLADVRDVVRAYAALMESGTSGDVYNVAAGTAYAVREVIEALLGLTSSAIRVQVDASRLRPRDNPMLVGDASKLRAQTGWVPEVPFERTLADLLDYWRERVGRTG